MTNTLVAFDFEDHAVRALMLDGEPWWVGKDVCRILEIEKHHQALERLEDDERGTYTVGTPSGDQQMVCVNEPGLYRLIFASRKPAAERFKRWLAHEVLPALRRTGRYEIPVAVDGDEYVPTDEERWDFEEMMGRAPRTERQRDNRIRHWRAQLSVAEAQLAALGVPARPLARDQLIAEIGRIAPDLPYSAILKIADRAS